MESMSTEEFLRRMNSGQMPADWQPARGRKGGKRKSNQEVEQDAVNQLFDELVREGFKPVREYMFHKKRKWRIDIFLPDYGLAIEVEGGIWTGGRHVRGEGYQRDVEKYNEVEVEGLGLLRFTTDHVKKSEAMPVILRKIEKIEMERRKNERNCGNTA